MITGLCAGFAMDFFMVLWQTALQTQIPRESLSRVSSYDAFGSLGLAPLGIIISGPLVLHFGTTTVLRAFAVIFFIVLLAVVAVPSVRSLPNNEQASRTTD